MTKQEWGGLLILVAFIILFIMTIMAQGFWIALLIWTITAVVVTLVLYGIYLLVK
jgi:hypothetical protein